MSIVDAEESLIDPDGGKLASASLLEGVGHTLLHVVWWHRIASVWMLQQ